MAKWGEGDPRWIVEQRPDATNVNNWHWTEKDASSWSMNKFNELLVGLKIESSVASCEITELTKTEGDASVTNRRRKLAFFYDWVLNGSWEGKLADGQKKIKGKFDVPNLGEEHDTEEVVVNISIDKDTDEARAVKEFMRTEGMKAIHQQFDKYIMLLKEEYSQGVQLPSKNDSAVEVKSIKTAENTMKKEMNKIVESKAPSSSSKQTSDDVGVRIPTTAITIKETFRCTPDYVYRALTDQGMVRVYLGDGSMVDSVPGGRFVLMGGNVLGEFTQLVPDSKVCMRWRMKSWPEEHYSNVTIDLEEKDGDTKLSMKQTGVPQKELDRTRDGWKVNFWERMKTAFRMGTNI